MKNKKIIRIVLIVLLVATLGFIWGHSTMPPEESSEESGIVKEIIENVIQTVSGDDTFALPEFLIRKSAHFLEYATLGGEFIALFVLGGLTQTDTKTFRLYFMAGVPSLLTGMVDETIQGFTGRYSSVMDVWLDFAGASFAIIIFLLIRNILSHTNHLKQEHNN